MAECTCIAAWAKRPNVRVKLDEHHPDCALASTVRAGSGGTAMVIDHDKIGPEGWKLMGGIDTLRAAEMTVRRIRERSTAVQERMFLAEIGDLLAGFAGDYQVKLMHLAEETGAVDVQRPLSKQQAAKLN